MISTTERLKLKEDSRLNKQFSYKGFPFLIYAPGLIALAGGFLLIALGVSDAAGPYLLMASLITLLSGSVDVCRRKIIRQDQVIRELQEKLETHQATNTH